MAKKSAIEKNKHRRKLVQQYAAKRAELRAIDPRPHARARGALRGDARARGAAAQQRQGARAQPLRADRPAARLSSQVRSVADRAARARLGRADPGPGQVQLVGGATERGASMTMSDPLGDMLTRIRNGQAAHKAAVVSPASKLRVNVLEVLRREGYIRGFRAPATSAIGELSIELKYHDGEPVIRELQPGLEAGPADLFRGQGSAAGLQRARHRDPVDAARRHVGRRGARGACRRRSPLHGVLTMSRIGKHPVAVPSGVKVDARRPDPHVERQARQLSREPAAARSRSARRTAASRCGRAATPSARAAMWGTVAHAGRQHGRRRVEGLHPPAGDQRRRLPRRARGQDPQPAARLQPRHQIRDPGRHRGRSARARPRSRSPAPTASGSARSRPRSARSASPSPTRARASATTTRSILRKEGKKK